MRLAIVSTPRSGNTWLRLLLAHHYRGATEQTAHTPAEVEWPRLPERFLLQLHWLPTPAFVGQLESAGVRPVVLARHPLDVLVSILHFCVYEPITTRWLDGQGGDERPIFALPPRSPVVADYLAGPRGQALLEVSRAWWPRPGAITVRYEDLVSDPHAELARLEALLGPPLPGETVASSVAACTIPKLRGLTNSDHFWQGRPGLWRSLFPNDAVAALRPSVRASLDLFGYDCDADPALTDRQADANWATLMGEGLAAKLAKFRERDAKYGDLLATHTEALHAHDRLARAHDAALTALGDARKALALAGPFGWFGTRALHLLKRGRAAVRGACPS